jgi:hypothetical protein
VVDLSSRPPATQPPAPVAYVRDLLAGFGPRWYLCGGWAVDDWLGWQTRHHLDVDIAVFHHDQRAIFEHLPGWAMVGHDPNVPDDTTEPWNGRHLDLPAHIHVPVLGSSLSTSTAANHSAYEFEFLLNEGTGDGWVLNQERHVVVALDRATRRSAWGLRTLTPEVVMFYKAGGHLTAAELESGGDAVRAHDEQDFVALLPTLSDTQRDWLRRALASARPGHPWLPRLGAG